MAFEVQYATGFSSEIFLNKLCKNLSTCTEETRAGSFLSRESPLQNRLRTLTMYSALLMMKLLSKTFLFIEPREQQRSFL